MANGETTARLVLRNRTQLAAGWACIALLIGGPLGSVLWLYVGSWPSDDLNLRYAAAAMVVAVLVFWAYMIRPRVVADNQSVLVVEPISSRRLAWSDIQSVVVEMGLYGGVTLTTNDGRVVRPSALQSGFAFGRTRAGRRWLTDVAAELEGLRGRA